MINLCARLQVSSWLCLPLIIIMPCSNNSTQHHIICIHSTPVQNAHQHVPGELAMSFQHTMRLFVEWQTMVITLGTIHYISVFEHAFRNFKSLRKVRENLLITIKFHQNFHNILSAMIPWLVPSTESITTTEPPLTLQLQPRPIGMLRLCHRNTPLNSVAGPCRIVAEERMKENYASKDAGKGARRRIDEGKPLWDIFCATFEVSQLCTHPHWMTHFDNIHNNLR